MEAKYSVVGVDGGRLCILRIFLDVRRLGIKSDDCIPGGYTADHRPAHEDLEVRYFTGGCILVLAGCVLLTALPEYREMDRKEKFMHGCMTEWIGEREAWQHLMTCERMWKGGNGGR